MELKKKITLAGTEYEIPELAIRQNRFVVPLFSKVFPVIRDKAKEEKLNELSAENIEDMLDIVYHAMTRGFPHLKKEVFLDWKISISELLAALPVISELAGYGRKDETQMGEPKGENQPSPPIGEGSTTT